MPLLEQKSSFSDLWENRQVDLGDILKIVVDIELELIALDAEMHADLEEELLKKGCSQLNLWGANLIHKGSGVYNLEYTSFINIRPAQNNRAMEIQDSELRKQIKQIVNNWIS